MTYNPSVEYRTGTLAAAQGKYPAGCRVTTDPQASTAGSKVGEHVTFRVDPKRFETWVKLGSVKLLAEPKASAEKKGKVSADG